jgi:glycosyltransferase involved in cell wall biosynthesis
MEDYQDIEDCANVGEFSGCFNFCFVGEMIKRKNIETLLRAFHTEFHPSEPVNLFLKLSKPGYSHDETLKHFDALSDSVKRALKIRKNYKKEIAITGHLESRHLHSLIGKCDCFIMPSFGEAWCIPALESMAMGIPVIHTANTGMDDFCVGWRIPSSPTPCYMATDSMDSVYTSLTRWMEPDLEAMCSIMRVAYETYKNNPKQYNNKRDESIAKAREYDTKCIGKKLKELLYE